MSLDLENVALTLAGRPLVSDVSLELRPGEGVGLLGPNGAGKTTTLRIICTLLAPDSGQVKVSGVNALTDPRSTRRQIGYVKQRPFLRTGRLIDLILCKNVYYLQNNPMENNQNI